MDKSIKWLRKNGFIYKSDFYCDRCHGIKQIHSNYVIDHGCGEKHMTCVGCAEDLTDNFIKPISDITCYYCETGTTPTTTEELFDFDSVYSDLDQ